jgi:tRNA-splicing ligase RtcB (3'-phosphate/5'-hydroxy nucleic acid ligase)
VEQITPRLMNWASILDQEARQQAIKTASMDFIHPHVDYA